MIVYFDFLVNSGQSSAHINYGYYHILSKVKNQIIMQTTIYSTNMWDFKKHWQNNKLKKSTRQSRFCYQCSCFLSGQLATLSFFFCWFVSLPGPVFLGPKYFWETAYSSTPVPSMVTMAPDPSPAANIRDFPETCGFLAMTVVVVPPVGWKHSHFTRPFFCIDNHITNKDIKIRKVNNLQIQQNMVSRCVEILKLLQI